MSQPCCPRGKRPICLDPSGVSPMLSPVWATSSPRLSPSRVPIHWIGFGYAALVASGGIIGYAKAGAIFLDLGLVLTQRLGVSPVLLGGHDSCGLDPRSPALSALPVPVLHPLRFPLVPWEAHGLQSTCWYLLICWDRAGSQHCAPASIRRCGLAISATQHGLGRKPPAGVCLSVTVWQCLGQTFSLRPTYLSHTHTLSHPHTLSVLQTSSLSFENLPEALFRSVCLWVMGCPASWNIGRRNEVSL